MFGVFFSPEVVTLLKPLAYLILLGDQILKGLPTDPSLLLVSHPAVNQFAYQRHSRTYATLILPNDFKQLSVCFPVIIYKIAFLIYDTTFHSANSHYALSIPLSFTKTDERKTFWVGNLAAPSNGSRAPNRI